MISSWMHFSSAMIFREVDDAAERMSIQADQTLLHYSNRQQMLGFMKASKYQYNQCKFAKERGGYYVIQACLNWLQHLGYVCPNASGDNEGEDTCPEAS